MPPEEPANDGRDRRVRPVGMAGGPIDILLLILCLGAAEEAGGGALVAKGMPGCGDDVPEEDADEARRFVGDLVGD